MWFYVISLWVHLIISAYDWGPTRSFFGIWLMTRLVCFPWEARGLSWLERLKRLPQHLWIWGSGTQKFGDGQTAWWIWWFQMYMFIWLCMYKCYIVTISYLYIYSHIYIEREYLYIYGLHMIDCWVSKMLEDYWGVTCFLSMKCAVGYDLAISCILFGHLGTTRFW